MDYVLLDLIDCRSTSQYGNRSRYTQQVREVIDSGEFGVRYWTGRILLLERNTPVGPDLDEVRAYVDQIEEDGRPCWP